MPKVEQVDRLVPGEKYVVYIGGLSATDTLNLPLEFQTINPTASNFQLISASPGQVGGVERDVHDFFVDLAQQLRDDTFSSEQAYSKKQRIIYLNGNILSLDTLIGKYIVDSLASIDSDAISDTWITILDSLEAKINDIYRQFFNHHVLHTCGHFRRHGWMITAGSQECGIHVYHQYDHHILFPVDTNKPSSSMQSPHGKSNASVDSKKTPQSWINKKKQYYSSDTSKDNNTHDSPSHNKTSDKDSSKSIFGAQMKSELSLIREEAKKHESEMAECHRLLVSCVARMQRRCYYKYFRQLWDEQWEELREQEQEMEERLRKVRFVLYYFWK